MNKRHVKRLITAAMNLHKLRVWREVPRGAPFMISLPGEALPWFCLLRGGDGVAPAVRFLRGPHARNDMKALVFEDPDCPSATGMDGIGLLFEARAGLAPPFERFLQSGGFKSGLGSAAPAFISTHPSSAARAPDAEETILLILALEGILQSRAAGDLQPEPLGSNTQNFLQLSIEGTLKNSACKTQRRVPPPTIAAGLPPLSLPQSMATLPKSPGKWIIALRPLDPELPQEEQIDHALIVIEDSDKPILGIELVDGTDAENIRNSLVAIFKDARNEKGRAYLPERIVFSEPEMIETFGPSLRALGMTVQRGELPLEIETAIQRLSSELTSPMQFQRSESVPDADDLEGWKQAELELIQSEIAIHMEEAPKRAQQRFFGSKMAARKFLSRDRVESAIVAFGEWLFADYRPTVRSKTHLEKRLEDPDLTELDILLLEARRDAHLSIFRVDSTQPGASLEVADIFSDATYSLNDRLLSTCEVDDTYLILRVARAGAFFFPIVAGPPMGFMQIERAMDFLDEEGIPKSAKGLRENSHKLGALFALFAETPPRRPILTNTDGDLLLRITATFKLADPSDTAARLNKREDIYAQSPSELDWFREGGPGGIREQTTLLGRIEFMDDRAVCEVNSTNRLAKLRAILESLPGVTFEDSTERPYGSDARAKDDQLPGKPPESFPPELLDRVRHMVLQQAIAQLDEPIPMFQGRTLRKMVKSEEGREEAFRWIRTMPPISIPGGTIPPPREELMRELGLRE